MVFAKNGRVCPMCEYLTSEMANPCGLEKGWYKDDSSKIGNLAPCNHSIPDGQENLYNSAITHYENELKELKRKRRLVIKAKTTTAL